MSRKRERRAERRSGERLKPNLLDMVPIRSADWEEDPEGRITLVRTRPTVRGLRSGVRWLAYHMAPARVRLDDVGSYAWLRMDGTMDVRSVAAGMRAEFGDRVEPVHERLGQLVRILRREHLVRYREEVQAP